MVRPGHFLDFRQRVKALASPLADAVESWAPRWQRCQLGRPGSVRWGGASVTLVSPLMPRCPVPGSHGRAVTSADGHARRCAGERRRAVARRRRRRRGRDAFMAPPGKSGEAALAVQAFAAAVAKHVRGKGCSSEGCSWKDCRSKALQLEGLQVGRTAGWKHCSWEDCRLELGQPEQDYRCL